MIMRTLSDTQYGVLTLTARGSFPGLVMTSITDLSHQVRLNQWQDDLLLLQSGRDLLTMTDAPEVKEGHIGVTNPICPCHSRCLLQKQTQQSDKSAIYGNPQTGQEEFWSFLELSRNGTLRKDVKFNGRRTNVTLSVLGVNGKGRHVPSPWKPNLIQRMFIFCHRFG